MQAPAAVANADYVRGELYPYAFQGLPNYYDWVAWYNEMLSLLY